MPQARLLIPIVFISGFVSLVYQTVWLREMRLFFGASTPATAAVTGIFMLGLGIGGLVLGRRVDRSPTPLRFYGWVEIGISAFTALTLLSTPVSRTFYLWLGGSQTLGLAGATILRIFLAALIIGPATFMMGATLPAAARSYTSRGDESRRGLGLLYGTNTIGAVIGTLASTFLLLEILGHRGTLSVAVLLNALIGVAALALAKQAEEQTPVNTLPWAGWRQQRTLIYALAAFAGFTFFVLELVWYRMLAPILGGSTFTFGLILAMALAGIGIGGGLYALLQRDRQPGPSLLALTFGLQSVAVIVPWALGDRLAVTAALLNKLGAWGFGGSVLAWTLMTLIVVFPASLIAGYQFPVLVAMVGQGRDAIGRDTGEVYLWNTIGSLCGALSGGLILIPALGATNVWRGTALGIAALAVAALTLHVTQTRRFRAGVASVAIVIALVLAFATGPTAAWRHSPIGAGRVNTENFDRQKIRAFLNDTRSAIEWERDGIESSVALNAANGYAFIVNGKSDGHARGDAPTQVMAGLLAAFLHPDPRSAMVIGLGTGSTAGWLAAVPSIDSVDVAELEPAILHVAEVCTPVNRDVLRNPKVRTIIGDGREILLTSSDRYDVIFSEPSNPYRAGVAGLFTSDFYRAVNERLSQNGIFAQWVQSYEIDAPTLETIYATITGVFPQVQTWQTQSGDFLLIASREPLVLDAAHLRARLLQQPYREAATRIWMTYELEGVLAHFVGNEDLGRHLIQHSEPATDDRNTIEFGFARQITREGYPLHTELRQHAASAQMNRPSISGQVDWTRVEELASSLPTIRHIPEPITDEQRLRLDVTQSFMGGRCSDALASWSQLGRPARGPFDFLILGSCNAQLGDVNALRYAAAIEPTHPTEAALMRGILAAVRKDDDEGPELLAAALVRHRTDPWPPAPLVEMALQTLMEAGTETPSDPLLVRQLAGAVSVPFAVRSAEERRRQVLLFLSEVEEGSTCGPRTVSAIEAFEPHVPWTREFLERRARCYRRVRHPKRDTALAELNEYLQISPVSIPPPPASATATGEAPAPPSADPGYRVTTGSSAAVRLAPDDQD